jgi:hypothetical protein
MNFCLTCIMDDILALSDITEVESQRLSEICRILHALEGLFIDDPEQVRVSASAASAPYSYRCSPPSLSHAFPHGLSSHIFPSFWCVVFF